MMVVMKRLAIFIFGLFLSYSIFAQKANKYGQKVISEILIEAYVDVLDPTTKYTHKYVYTYSDDLSLKGLKYYGGNNKLEEEFILKNDVLVRKSYVYVHSDTKWEYDFDLYGNIAKTTEYSYGSDGSVVKYEEYYTYEYSKEHKWWQLIEDRWTEWYKPKNSKCYYKQDFEPCYKYCYIDGIMYDKKSEHNERAIKYVRDKYNMDIKNDTNIDLNRIVESYTKFVGIEATEWNRRRTEYLKIKYYPIMYDYIYNNGYLVEIGGGKYMHIYIKYLY